MREHNINIIDLRVMCNIPDFFLSLLIRLFIRPPLISPLQPIIFIHRISSTTNKTIQHLYARKNLVDLTINSKILVWILRVIPHSSANISTDFLCFVTILTRRAALVVAMNTKQIRRNICGDSLDTPFTRVILAVVVQTDIAKADNPVILFKIVFMAKLFQF